jgi:hypothetical protein
VSKNEYNVARLMLNYARLGPMEFSGFCVFSRSKIIFFYFMFLFIFVSIIFCPVNMYYIQVT